MSADKPVTVPDLSVVIASINGRPYLDRCLAALQRQTGDVVVEVIVADCVGQSVTEFVSVDYPRVRLIAFDGPRSVPQLRAAAIAVAAGRVIALTEDHCIPPSDWVEAIRRAHLVYPGPVIGGAVDNGATARILDWAVFFCEYSQFISPVPHGVVHDLPGPNVSYKRGGLRAIQHSIGDEFWETFVHGHFLAQGDQLWSDPSIRIIHQKFFTLSGFLAERYHYSRAFAGQRNESMGKGRRLLYCLLALLLPPVILARLSRRVINRQRHLGPFLRSSPYLLIFAFVWAVGESVGYASGPGKSALYLR